MGHRIKQVTLANYLALGCSGISYAQQTINIQGYGSIGYSALLSIQGGKIDPLNQCLGQLGTSAAELEILARSDGAQALASQAAQQAAQQAGQVLRSQKPDASSAEIQAAASAAGTTAGEQAAKAYALRSFAETNCNQDTDNKVKEFDGQTKKGTFARDLKLGLNLISQLDPYLTAQALIGSESKAQIDGSSGDPTLDVKLLLLRYQAWEQFTFIFGQQPVPLWMISEEKAVGYTYPWVRPPTQVYGLSDLSSLQGLRGIHTLNFGDYSLKSSLSAGQINNGVGDTGFKGASISMKAAYFNLDLEKDNFYVRSVYGRGKGTVNVALASSPSGSSAGDDVAASNVSINKLEVEYRFFSVGFRATPNHWLIMSEYASVPIKYYKTSGVLANILDRESYSDLSGYYLTLGYTFLGKITPRLTYGKGDTVTKYTGKGLNDLSAALGAVGVDPRISDIRTQAGSTQMNVGVNYQLSEKAVVKLEWEQVKVRDCDLCEGFGPGQPDLPRGAKATAARSVIDFVF